MGEPIRAGGYVIRESGWELDSSTPRPAAAPLSAPPDEPATELAVDADDQPEPETEEPEAEAGEGPQRDRDECPDCGKDVAVNKDGTLRKHTCLIDAPPPEVTFDSQEGDV